MSGRYTAHGGFQILLGGKSVYMTQILQKDIGVQNAVVSQWPCGFIMLHIPFN
jgi:hypothetical protein